MDPREFPYLQNRRFFAVVNEGLEDLARAELERLGADRVRAIRRGVHFEADPGPALDVLFGSRLVGRILAPLSGFDCHSSRYLLRRAKEIPFEEMISPEGTFAVTATVVNSRAKHSKYVALVLKDAVCDRLREARGRRPSVDRENPDLRLHVHLERDFATVSVDLGDGSRHRRGYRLDAGDAPLPETVAAGLLELAGYAGERPLLDPKCGSGTLLAEAVMRAGDVPAAFALRRVGAQRLPGFGEEAFRTARARWMGRARAIEEGSIRGNDLDPKVLAVAARNLERVPGGEGVRIRRGDFRDHPGLQNGLIACNPPWGMRMEDAGRAEALVKDLGDFLKQKCRGSEAWLVLGNRDLVKSVGLRAARKVPVGIGGLDARFVKYELY
jgi:putative N6-adenine-specific DNA methylase